jgi:hypothetical protein
MLAYNCSVSPGVSPRVDGRYYVGIGRAAALKGSNPDNNPFTGGWMHGYCVLWVYDDGTRKRD